MSQNGQHPNGQHPNGQHANGQHANGHHDTAYEHMLSVIAHELRSQVAIITGLADVLAHERDNLEESKEVDALDRLQRTAVRLDDMLTDLMDIDHNGQGLRETHRCVIDVRALVAAAVAGTPLRPGRRVDVHVPPIVADVDPMKVERIIENLVANADKYAPDGTIVDVVVSHRDDQLLISVRDRGPGVAEDERDTIFEPFDRGTLDDANGHGVGLAIVASFAALHGGDATVSSRPGGGSSFDVTLHARTERAGSG